VVPFSQLFGAHSITTHSLTSEPLLIEHRTSTVTRRENNIRQLTLNTRNRRPTVVFFIFPLDRVQRRTGSTRHLRFVYVWNWAEALSPRFTAVLVRSVNARTSIPTRNAAGSTADSPHPTSLVSARPLAIWWLHRPMWRRNLAEKIA